MEPLKTKLKTENIGSLLKSNKPNTHKEPRESAHRFYIKHEEKSFMEKIELLSSRERQVFDLSMLLMTQKEIGEELNISQRTVEINISNVLLKLNGPTLARQTVKSLIANYYFFLGRASKGKPL